MYTSNSFNFSLIEVLDLNELIKREQYYIDTLKPYYNICLIAGSSLGIKRREVTKNKVRLANLGLKHPDWRNEIKSKSQGGDNHWTKQKCFSQLSKTKMSITHKKKYLDGYINPNKLSIIQFDKDMNKLNEWDSISDAAKFYNIDRMAIANCIHNRTKTSKGFIWKFKNEII